MLSTRFMAAATGILVPEAGLGRPEATGILFPEGGLARFGLVRPYAGNYLAFGSIILTQS